MGPAGRRGRRRGLIVGAAIGSARARNNDQAQQQAAPAEPAASNDDDQYIQLEKLGQLHKDGILTDEEFEAKKKQILGL